MTYIITEDELRDFVYYDICKISDRKELERKIKARPLSAELKKERDRVLRDFENWCGSFDDYTCGTVFTPSFVLKKLQSLRGDP